jgi:hypothetical protein
MKNVKLLSNGEINHKMKKNTKMGYLTHSLNFAHSDLSGFNVCPMAKRLSRSGMGQNKNLSSCSSVCVGGNGFASIHPIVLESRIAKTISFKLDTQNFMLKLISEIENAIKLAKKKNLKPTFRLNAYSDILWEKQKTNDLNGKMNIFEMFPNVTFYDYTKINNRKTPKNYQLTFSHYGDFKKTSEALENGFNSAIVFESLPSKIKINNKIYTVIDGDKTDLRIDEKINGDSVVVGLKFKGSKAKLNDASLDGFCISKNNSSLIWEV